MKILKSIKIEDIVLIFISLFFLIWLFFLEFFTNNPETIFKIGWTTIASSANWWGGGALIFSAIIIFRIYLFLTEITSRGISFGLLNWNRAGDFLKNLPFLLKTPFIILMTSAFGILTAGLIQLETKNKLLNSQILNADKILTAKYPLFWLHSSSNNLKGVLDFLTPAIIYAFLSLGVIMGLLAIILYLEKNRRFFKGYIMSLFIAFAMAVPFWFFIPVNSPSNYFLHNSGQNFNTGLSEAINGYQPNDAVEKFQEKIWQSQKNSPPVTTLPSMHWAWSIIIVYYAFKKAGWTILISPIWLSLVLFGTIYLGNHYLMDGLAAIPLTIASLFSAELLVRVEKRYFEENARETELTEKIREWLLEPLYQAKQKLLIIKARTK